MKLMRKTTALVVFALALVAATAAAAENIVAPEGDTFPARAGNIPATGDEFSEALNKKLDEFESLRKNNMLRIIEQRDAFAEQLENAGLAEWAAKNREFTDRYRETPPTRSTPRNAEILLKSPATPLLSEMPERTAQQPQSIAGASLVVWGVIGVVWMLVLAGLRGLRSKTKLRRLAWLLLIPATAALLLLASILGPSIGGRTLLPAFLAPGSFLVLLLGALAYMTIRLFRKKAWIKGVALVCGVLLAFGLLALGAAVGMTAIPEEISDVKITGEKRIDSSGTITIENIAFDDRYNVAWSLKNLRVRASVPALMWGSLEGVDIRIGEVDVFINRSLPSAPKKEGKPLTLDRVIKHLRSLGAVKIEKITVQLARQGKAPLMIFEGGTSVTRYSADEIGGEITGRILSMSDLTVKWRGDMAQRNVVMQYNFGGLEFDTDTLARIIPKEIGIDLAASGWKIGGGLSVSGKVKLDEDAKTEWFADVRLSAGVLQWPGLPLPMIGLAGAILIDPTGASVHDMRGRIAVDRQGTPPPDGMGDFVMSGEIDMSGNSRIEILSSGFPVSEGWLAMLVGRQDWLETLGLTGHADFRSTLNISLKDGIPKIENVSTEVMPSRLLISPTEPKVDVGVDLMTLRVEGDRLQFLLGDSNLAGGKLFGDTGTSLDDVSASLGWIAFKDVQFQKLQGLNSSAVLKGRMHGKLEIMDATLQSEESLSGTVWIQDVNTGIDPILSKLFAKLLMQIKVEGLDSDTCDIYCTLTAGKDGLKIQELRAFSSMLRIDAEGTVDYDGNLNLNGSLRLGSSLLASIPGIGKILDGIFGDIIVGKRFGLTSFQITGNYNDPKITLGPLRPINALTEKVLPPKSEDTTEP